MQRKKKKKKKKKVSCKKFFQQIGATAIDPKRSQTSTSDRSSRCARCNGDARIEIMTILLVLASATVGVFIST
jgi:hypothetical protein